MFTHKYVIFLTEQADRSELEEKVHGSCGLIQQAVDTKN